MEHLRPMQGVEGSTMTKYRAAGKSYLKFFARRAGNKVLTLSGLGEYWELSADGPEPNVWVSFELEPDFVAAAHAIRGGHGIGRGA